MRRWLPTITICGTTMCGHDGEYEGVALEIVWFGFLFEVAVLRRERQL